MASLFSIALFANTAESVFQNNSKVPSELQKRILSAINDKCESVLSKNGLTEVETLSKNVKYDQGMIDVLYTTIFTSRYYFDGTHPIMTTIMVESAEYAFQNGDNLEVINIDCELQN